MRFIVFLFISVFFAMSGAQAGIRKIAIASDGKTYAALSEAKGESYLIVYDAVDATVQPRILKLGDVSVGDFHIAGSSKVLLEAGGFEFAAKTITGLRDFSSAAGCRWI